MTEKWFQVSKMIATTPSKIKAPWPVNAWCHLYRHMASTGSGIEWLPWRRVQKRCDEMLESTHRGDNWWRSFFRPLWNLQPCFAGWHSMKRATLFWCYQNKLLLGEFGDPSTLPICVPYLCLAQCISVLWFPVWRNRSRPSNQFAESAVNGFAEPLATNSCLQCIRFILLWKINSRPIKQLTQADSGTNNYSRLYAFGLMNHFFTHWWTYLVLNLLWLNVFVQLLCDYSRASN